MMTTANNFSAKWVWPKQGPTTVNQGMDSEIFDRKDHNISETFVREALQNSLDARIKGSIEPAKVRFTFHQGPYGQIAPYLDNLLEHRSRADLSPSSFSSSETVEWLTVEDFNTSGLQGSVTDRGSDFWMYWMNFGLSNKQSGQRGGRGIGRVTFLIASRTQSVLALTRRHGEAERHICGMALLKAGSYPSTETSGSTEFKTSHSHFARQINEDVFDLHDTPGLADEFAEAFGLDGYSAEQNSGLALVVPFPHTDSSADQASEDGEERAWLSADRILAAAVEHFAPAIVSRQLVVEVSTDNQTRTLSSTTLTETVQSVQDCLKDRAVAARPFVFLDYLSTNNETTGDQYNIELKSAVQRNVAFRKWMKSHQREEIRKSLSEGEKVVLAISFPLRKNGNSERVSVTVICQQTEGPEKPMDLFFRAGMRIPDVEEQHRGNLDVAIFVEDSELANYLNLFEGKAHFDFIANKENTSKAKKQGYAPQEMYLVRALSQMLREMLGPDEEKPDRNLLASFFSIPEETDGKKKKKPDKPENEPDSPEDDIPKAQKKRVLLKMIEDGFRIEANPEWDIYPYDLLIEVGYADGSRNIHYSPFDFKTRDLIRTSEGMANKQIDKNKVCLRDCQDDLAFEMTGFDVNRELEIKIKGRNR
ncbi:MAG: hypothetical protein Alpg2KO_07980 [Alphaproteobacteria bacterium]